MVFCVFLFYIYFCVIYVKESMFPETYQILYLLVQPLACPVSLCGNDQQVVNNIQVFSHSFASVLSDST